MELIKINGETHYQDTDGTIISAREYLHGLTQYNMMIPDMREPDNTTDYRHTCPHCRTAYRESEQRDTTRCPYCWRQI